MTTDILFASLNTDKQFRISVIDIENGPDVRDLSVYQRKCRFPDENYLEVRLCISILYYKNNIVINQQPHYKSP